MRDFFSLIKEVALVATVTVGAGIFALPFVFYKTGWAMTFLALVVFSAVIISAHILYLKVLIKVREKHRLLGLVRIYLGETAFRVGFLVVVGGLFLTLVVFLLLASRFVNLIYPNLGASGGLMIFWLISSAPLCLGLKRLLGAELAGGVFMAAIVFFIFFNAGPGWVGPSESSFNLDNLIVLSGAVIFSLAGWTAIEPVLDSKKSQKRGLGKRVGFSVAWGTIFAAIIYLVFVVAIFASAGKITEDTLSGLTNWPGWKMSLLSLLGLFAIWTSYLPIALEIKNSIEKDLGWSRLVSLALVVFVPLALIAAGFNNFSAVIGLVGGVFLAFQYLFIIWVSKKVLTLSWIKRIMANALILIFLLVAFYEVYYFVVK